MEDDLLPLIKNFTAVTGPARVSFSPEVKLNQIDIFMIVSHPPTLSLFLSLGLFFY
jgi:hypothetical protein